MRDAVPGHDAITASLAAYTTFYVATPGIPSGHKVSFPSFPLGISPVGGRLLQECILWTGAQGHIHDWVWVFFSRLHV